MLQWNQRYRLNRSIALRAAFLLAAAFNIGCAGPVIEQMSHFPKAQPSEFQGTYLDHATTPGFPDLSDASLTRCLANADDSDDYETKSAPVVVQLGKDNSLHVIDALDGKPVINRTLRWRYVNGYFISAPITHYDPSQSAFGFRTDRFGIALDPQHNLWLFRRTTGGSFESDSDVVAHRFERVKK